MMQMRKWRSAFRAVVAATALLAGGAAVMVAPAAAATPQWTIAYTGRAPSVFSSAYALSNGDVWVAGFGGGVFCCTIPLLSHWNGVAWSSPLLPSGFTQSTNGYGGAAYDVTGSASNNVWALVNSPSNGHTYTLKWNGVHWSAQHDWGTSRLSGLAVLAPNNVWVADSTDYLKGSWHFNGTSWQLVRAPIIIDKLRALSATDIWAEGLFINSSGFAQPQVARWNGSSWLPVPIPNIPSADGQPYGLLSAIAAASDTDVWAGGYVTTTTGALRPFAIHWNGKLWTRKDPAGPSQLSFITPDGQGGAWAGDNDALGGTGILVHYANGVWTKVTVPGRNGAVSHIGQVAVVPRSTSAWAAAALTGPYPPAGFPPQKAEVLRY